MAGAVVEKGKAWQDRPVSSPPNTVARGRLRLRNSFDWRGHRVRWDRFGSGPPVVLCHGTPWSSYVWRSTVAELRRVRTLYLWDMLGYGQSDRPDADVSLATQGELLAALIADWGLESPDVVAHDFGGAVALRAHLLGGVGVGSLALVDVVVLSPWGSPFFRLVREHADVFTRLPPNLHRALVAEYMAGASQMGLQPQVVDALVEPWIGHEGQPAFYRQIAQADPIHTDEIEPLIREIDVPTLIVWGSDDSWIPVEQAHRLHELIRGSRLELIDGAGHLVQEDRPAELNRLLGSWLSSLGGPSPPA